jgi:hypothetical protein
MMGMGEARWMRAGLQAGSFALPLAVEVACNQVVANGIWSAWWTVAAVVLAAARASVLFLLSRARRPARRDDDLAGEIRRLAECLDRVAGPLMAAADMLCRRDGARAIPARVPEDTRHPLLAAERVMSLWQVDDLQPQQPDGPGPAGSPPGYARLLAAGASGAALAALGIGLWLRWGTASALVVATNQAIGLCLVVGGIAACRMRPGSTAGSWMTVMGVLVLVSNLSVGLGLPAGMPGHELAAVAGDLAQGMQLAVAGQILMDVSVPPWSAFRARAELLARIGWGLAAASAVLLPPAETLLTACRIGCDTGPARLPIAAQAYLPVRWAVLIAWTALALAALQLVTRQYRHTTDRERGLRRFAIVSCGAALALWALRNLGILAVYAAGHSIPARYLWFALTIITGWAVVLAIPVAFAVAFIGEQRMFARVAQLLGRLAPSAADFERELRAAVRDPALLVVAPAAGGILVDSMGRPFTRPPVHYHQTVLGTPPAGVLLHDSSLTRQPQLLSAAARTAFLALQAQQPPPAPSHHP